MSIDNGQGTRASIAVVGGGIAGLALARSLHARGFVAAVFERRAASTDGGMAVNLPGNAIRALAALGLDEAVDQVGHPLRRREYRTATDKLLFEIDEDRFWGEDMRPRSLRRSQLVQLLGTGLGDSVRRNADVRSVVSHPDRLDVILADGQVYATELLVGADGVRSSVRRQTFGRQSEPSHSLLAQASWRFMVPNPGIDCWTVWVGSHGMILLMPVAGNEVYGWAAITQCAADSTVGGLERLGRGFPGRVRRSIEMALAQPETILHSPLEDVRLPHWAQHRTVLIGDAAHASAPVWAQGVALALEDAIVLAECLAGDVDPLTAFGAYERRRRPRVEHVQAMTDAMARTAGLPALLRNAMTPFIGPKRYRKTYEPLKAVP